MQVKSSGRESSAAIRDDSRTHSMAMIDLPESPRKQARQHGWLRDLRACAREASRQTGKIWGRQIAEILSLRSMGGRCGASDYYWHRLYDDSYLAGRGRSDFLGWRLLEEFSTALNPRFAVLPAVDKLVFTQLARAAGLMVPCVRAHFHPVRHAADALGEHLPTPAAVGRFLRNPANFPVFGKPSFSLGGIGSAYLIGVDLGTDRLMCLDGSSIPIDEFLLRLERSMDVRYHRPQCGYLFQEQLALAPEVSALTSWPALCTVRVVCLNGPEGVVPIRAAWKIAMAPNHADNFGDLGDRGNLLADVDLETGSISRVIGGFWPFTQMHEVHPRSGKPFAGFRLPGWSVILDACRMAGTVFPLLRVNHWDFALTDRGPVILELNDIGGTQIPQMHGKGLLTEQTREFLRRFGDRRRHAWINAL
jgi:hypothetical protein